MSTEITIALAGNPNCGKTTMFNALTGAKQRVGNYPGVTVEKREGSLRQGDQNLNVVDLPGTYSLSAYTPEELVARNFLVEERPQVVVNVIDASSLERNLYLSLQFLELGIPMVLALNMMDEVRSQGKQIDTTLLSKALNVPVIETVARTGEGKQDLVRKAVTHARGKKGEWQSLRISYGNDLDKVIDQMAAVIEEAGFLTNRFPARWVAVKYLEEDTQVLELAEKEGSVGKELARMSHEADTHCRATLGVSPESIVADYRYGFIASILKKGIVKKTSMEDRVNISDKIDRVATNQLLGPVIMMGILYAIFLATFPIGEIPMGWLESFFEWLSGVATRIIPDGHLQSLMVDGIIGGVGGVLGFVPLIMVMFVMITILEDSGYTARMAYMMDRVLRVFGLHGSSLMPFIVSGGIPGGCAVPGVMAARTLRSPKEKLATILTAPFMSCGAKVPVFILLSAAFFGDNAPKAMFMTTLAGWAAALLVARLLRSTVIKGESTPFVMELPPYRLPTIRGVLIHTWERAWQYIKKAGTVILAISILIWAAMTFPGLPEERSAHYTAQIETTQARIDAARTEEIREALGNELAAIENSQNQEALRNSIAGRLGTLLEPVSSLAGFDWRTNIALLGGFAAKEVIVSSLGTAYAMGEVDAEESGALSDRLAADATWNVFTAVGLMMFVLLYAPCFVTVVVLARESSWGWATFSVVFNTLFAYGVAVGIYQIGTRFFL